jgi:ribosomal protein S18 acetylase RimI-like enzyme
LTEVLIPGYQVREGSRSDRALLIKFMARTYQELFPEQEDFSHLRGTVESYLSHQTPLWWVQGEAVTPVACLWLGQGIDQVNGEQYAHIFLLYVKPEHRRQGIGSALMQRAQAWARARGHHRIGLQVFSHNQPALNLYRGLGFEARSLLLMKPL